MAYGGTGLWHCVGLLSLRATRSSGWLLHWHTWSANVLLASGLSYLPGVSALLSCINSRSLHLNSQLAHHKRKSWPSNALSKLWLSRVDSVD